MNEKAEYHPEWEPDCQGKWDYDYPLVSLSCRYYPRGGGYDVYHNGAWEVNEDRPEIGPTAQASICIGDLVNGPYETLAEAYFGGKTESEVKRQVELWAEEMIERVEYAIRKEFLSAQQLPESDGGDSADQDELSTPEGGSDPEGDLHSPAAA